MQNSFYSEFSPNLFKEKKALLQSKNFDESIFNGKYNKGIKNSVLF